MKNFKKLTTILLSLVLTISSVSYIYADEDKTSDSGVEKQETVYAFLDANGNFKSATVSEWLHSDNGFVNVKDESYLSDIKNLKGDEQPSINGNTLTWNSDSSDIYYQGTSTKELPLNMQVTYYFDGQKVDVEDVVGQSGKLEIHIKLINNQEKTEVINGKTRHISTLFPCIILTDLKTDIFEDVDADGAIMVNESKNQLVSFVTVSGASKLLNDASITELNDVKDKLKDEFVIKANVKDFEMPSIYCAVSGMVDLDSDDISASDLDELKNGINDLQDAMNEILDGSSELDKGANDLKSGANTLNDGVNSLKDGIKQAQSGANTLNDKSSTLTAGSAQIKAGLKQLQDSLNGASSESVTALVEGSETFKTSLDTVNTNLNNLASGYDTYKTSLSNAGVDLSSLATNNSDLAAALSQLATSENLTEEQVATLTSAIQVLSADSQVLEGANTYIETAGQGSKQLAAGLSQLNQGYTSIDSGIKQIGALMADPDSEAMKNITTLKGAVDQLYAGDTTLDSGINEYTNGVASLKSGLDEIASGADKLSDGSKELLDGSNSLASGADTLNDGLNKFNSEGINELSSKVNDAISTLDDVVDVVNEVLDQSVEYNNYAGVSTNTEASVKFIMKTDEVSATDKEETKTETTLEVKEDSTTFWQRLVNLFKKTA